MSAEKVGNKAVVVPGSRESAPSIYVDGVAEMNFGSSICKLAFHQAAPGATKGTENRSIVMTVVVPMPVLVEMCVNILKSIDQNKEKLRSNVDFQYKKVFEMLEKVNVDSDTSVFEASVPTDKGTKRLS